MQGLTLSAPGTGSDVNPDLLSWIDRNWQVMVALYAVCTVMAGMRIFARAKVLNQFGADDGTMLLAWVCTDCSKGGSN